MLTMKDSAQSVVLYLMILIVSTCIIYVGCAGPVHLGYHDTSKDSNYYYFNLTTFSKTLYTMYLIQTSTNYPDVMVYKWQDQEVLQGFMFCIYMFIMGSIIMNIMTGIFYGNYKKHFSAIAETLSNQHQLCRIIDASVDKDGRMHMHSIHHLLDTFHYEPKEKFECEVKKATIKKQKHKLKKLIRTREEALAKKNAMTDATEDIDTTIKHCDRKPGYNRKHKEFFKKIQKNFVYKYFFVVLNLMIAIKPIYMLDFIHNEAYFAMNYHDQVD